MDKAQANAFQRDLVAAVKAVAEKHKMEPTKFRLTYDSEIGGARLTVGFDSTEDGAAKLVFESYAPLYGYDPKAFGSVIKVKGMAYKVVGLDTAKRSFPVKAERVSDGKVFGLRLSVISKAAADFDKRMDILENGTAAEASAAVAGGLK